jgi:hypothetical protein
MVPLTGTERSEAGDGNRRHKQKCTNVSFLVQTYRSVKAPYALPNSKDDGRRQKHARHCKLELGKVVVGVGHVAQQNKDPQQTKNDQNSAQRLLANFLGNGFRKDDENDL